MGITLRVIFGGIAATGAAQCQINVVGIWPLESRLWLLHDEAGNVRSYMIGMTLLH
jgi:hypothetical protein